MEAIGFVLPKSVGCRIPSGFLIVSLLFALTLAPLFHSSPARAQGTAQASELATDPAPELAPELAFGPATELATEPAPELAFEAGVSLPVPACKDANYPNPEGRTIVMLGDSLTAGGKWDELDPKAKIINQGVSGDGYRHILARLDETISEKPDVVFLQVGINDFGRVPRIDDIAAGHRKIWDRLREALPGVRLVICSLIPLNERMLRRTTGYNSKVRELNEILAEMAAKENLEFVDLYGPIAGPDRGLPRNLTFDGIHLTNNGHRIWFDELKAFMDRTTPLPASSDRADTSPSLGCSATQEAAALAETEPALGPAPESVQPASPEAVTETEPEALSEAIQGPASTEEGSDS
ncbi:MAG: GDSL-type esterase/lipase family protein [Deltaproteobacteria bacterium]|jgi:lysophospholipase L1-like esterase|nr:GDSL-type esterase/lipase family protein [Deltaproteobacteria bacterium]